MKYIVLVGLALLLVTAPALAQTPATGASKIAWDQAAPSLADAQGYTYKYYPDGAAVGVPLVSVTCTGTASPYQCEVAFPAFTPGNHTLTLTTGNVAGDSERSAPLGFAFVLIPSAPVNLRIK